MPNFFLSLRSFDMTEASHLAPDRKALYDRLISYVESGLYTKRNCADLIYKGYKKSTPELVAESGLTTQAVLKLRQRVSQDLECSLGKGILDRLAHGDSTTLRTLAIALDACEVLKGDIKQRGGVSDRFPKAVSDACTVFETEYKLGDCMPEISFLHFLSDTGIRGMLNKLDKGKLSFLMHLLSDSVPAGDSLHSIVASVVFSDCYPWDILKAVDRDLLRFPPLSEDEKKVLEVEKLKGGS